VDSRLALPPNTVLDNSYRIVRLVGTGGFGVTYEAEDINLGTQVAIKEYYPFDFGDRDVSMSVRPRSDRHKKTFEWGKTNFLQEARNLARFEHPSIVRVTRVFEANSTAYMVMRFEQGQSFEDWLRALGRPPTQDELDAITAPLLDALQMMHRADFLHRDIAPDNIIVRADGTPVLLDFGAARRAVAEMSRSLTGIVKAGYSPHEQYTSDNRFQGPWSDLYAFGGTLYRAVTGKPPEEATLRVDSDHMLSAVQSAKGNYRKEFLTAIDDCLKVRGRERPQSVTQLRSKILGPELRSKTASKRAVEPPKTSSRGPQGTRRVSPVQSPSTARRWVPIAAAIVAIVGGAYGGYEFTRWQPDGEAERPRTADAYLANMNANEKREVEITRAAERARQEAEARRIADAARAKKKADEEQMAARQEEERLAAEKRAVDDALRETEARRQRDERIAAEDEERRQAEAEEQRRASKPVRIANIGPDPVREASVTLSAEERVIFIKRVQDVLTAGQCYDGPANGRASEAQDALDRFVDRAHQKGKGKPIWIELAKATASDFDTWLREADDVKNNLCSKPKAEKPVAQVRERTPVKERAPEQRVQRAPQRDSSPSYQRGGGGGGGGGGSPRILGIQ